MLRAGPAEERERKGKTAAKNCKRQKKCQCLEGYWRIGLFFLGGRNLNEVTQRNCMECESPRTKNKGSKTWKTRYVSAK